MLEEASKIHSSRHTKSRRKKMISPRRSGETRKPKDQVYQFSGSSRGNKHEETTHSSSSEATMTSSQKLITEANHGGHSQEPCSSMRRCKDLQTSPHPFLWSNQLRTQRTLIHFAPMVSSLRSPDQLEAQSVSNLSPWGVQSFTYFPGNARSQAFIA